MKKHILLVDGLPWWRWHVRNVLNVHAGLKVVGEAGDGLETIELVSEQRPDVLIINISLFSGTTTEMIRDLKDRFPHLGILVVTSYEVEVCQFEMFKAEVDGHLLENASIQDYCDAIHDTAGAVRTVASVERGAIL